MIDLQSYAGRIQAVIAETQHEKALARRGRWYWDNVERERERARAFYLANQDTIRVKRQIYYAENKELLLERMRLHPRLQVEYSRQYREANREKLRVKARTYRAKKKAERS